MTMDWKECCDKKIAKNVKPDVSLMNSLIKSSENNLKSESMLPMTNVTAGSKLSLAYDSLRELLEALAIKKGYKIYNHECYTAFLKEVLKQSNAGELFDEIRKVRNAVNYYGKIISPEEADKIIIKIKSLREFISTILKQ